MCHQVLVIRVINQKEFMQVLTYNIMMYSKPLLELGYEHNYQPQLLQETVYIVHNHGNLL